MILWVEYNYKSKKSKSYIQKCETLFFTNNCLSALLSLICHISVNLIIAAMQVAASAVRWYLSHKAKYN